MRDSKRRARDPLTAALSDIFLPAVRPLGFDRQSARLVVRLSDGILQLLSFQKTAYGGGDFCVNYASMALFLPREYIVLEPGGRLTGRPLHVDRWWSSADHETADRSMAEVLDAFHVQGRPFFESTRTVSGLLHHLLPIRLDDHHYEFCRGACFARLGSVNEAVLRLRRAVELYHADGRDWCAQFADQATTLMKACQLGTHSSVLAEWEAFTRSRLRLPGTDAFDHRRPH
jgi:hypothetical protein